VPEVIKAENFLNVMRDRKQQIPGSPKALSSINIPKYYL
jgi:hypothetical protein